MITIPTPVDPAFSPPTTTANEDALNAQAEAFVNHLGRIIGEQGTAVSDRMTTTAVEFSELVAEPLKANSALFMAAAEAAVEGAAYGSTVTGQLATAVTTFKQEITRLVNEWNAAAPNFGADPSVPGAVEEAKLALLAVLDPQAKAAHEALLTAADTADSMLKGGPTPANLQALAAGAGGGSLLMFNAFADEAGERADVAAGLLGGGADGVISPDELDRFNQIVTQHGADPLFAGALLGILGPRRYMGAIRDVVLPVYGRGATTSGFTPAQIDRFYRGMGTALATGTNPTNALGTRGGPGYVPHHVDKEWVTELMNFGAAPITTEQGAGYGYQLLAPALEHGEYHGDFIVPVTDHILAIDNSHDIAYNPVVPLIDMSAGSPFSSGLINSALTALGNSPDAATTFFTYGGTRLTDMEGVDLEFVNPVDDPFDYLMREADNPLRYLDRVSPDLLGNALEAGTTGVTAGDEIDLENPPQQTILMAGLTDRIINHVTADPDKFTSGPMSEMLDNFGGITAAYIDDFQRSMAPVPHLVPWIDSGATLYSIDNNPDSVGANPLDLADDWLQVVGHSRAGMARAWGASEWLLPAQMINAAENHEGQSSNAYGGAFELHGGVTAAMTAGTLDGIAEGAHHEQVEHNRVPNLFSEGIKLAASTFAGAKIPSAVISAATGQGAGYIIDPVMDIFRMTDDEVRKHIAVRADAALKEGEIRMVNPEINILVQEILSSDETLTGFKDGTLHGDKLALAQQYSNSYTSRLDLLAETYTR